MKKWQWLTIGILVGIGIALMAHAQTTTEITPTNTGNPWIQNDVIYKPNPPSESQPETKSTGNGGYANQVSGTPLRNKGSIPEQAIRQYLESKNSPLAPYSKEISDSPYSGTIIGISAIEQQYCKIRPGGSNWNCWGIMKTGGGLAYYSTAAQGISAIDNWLANHESRHSTIQSLNGYYVVPASTNWLNTVLKVKQELEQLENNIS